MNRIARGSEQGKGRIEEVKKKAKKWKNWKERMEVERKTLKRRLSLVISNIYIDKLIDNLSKKNKNFKKQNAFKISAKKIRQIRIK